DSAGTQTKLHTFATDASKYGVLNCDGPRCLAVGLAADIDVDAKGNRFVVANFDNAITRVDSTGNASSFYSGVDGATGIAVGPDGRLYVTLAPVLDANAATPAVTTGMRVVRLGADKVLTTVYEGPKSNAYAETGAIVDRHPLDAVFDVAVDGEGNLYL